MQRHLKSDISYVALENLRKAVEAVPAKVLPQDVEVRNLAEELTLRNFFPIQGLEHFRGSTKDERAVPPRSRPGAELGFAFRKDDLAVVVWTTWLLAEKKARDYDRGWVVIEEAGEGKYFISVYRTKNFIKHLLFEAKIARARVRYRPKCPTCQAPMRIERGRGLGSRYWRCPLKHARDSWDTKEFLGALSTDDEARKYLLRRRKQRERWQKQCRASGQPIRQAMLRRRPWRRIKLPITGF